MTAVDPLPDDYPRLAPYLCVDGAAEAIDFYTTVLGFTERMRLAATDGSIVHAELTLGDSLLMLSDEFVDLGVLGPGSVGGSPVALSVYVEDVDAVFERAVARGAEVRQAVTDRFHGDRSGQFIDPFGHRWSVATHVEDVSPEEVRRRMAEAGG